MFGLTVFVDLTVAIAVGMVLASFLFMKRMAEATEVAPIATALRASEEASEAELEARHRRVPRDVEVFDLNGPIFFGAAQRFADALRGIHWRPRAIILDMADVPIIDATGLRWRPTSLDPPRQPFRRPPSLLCSRRTASNWISAGPWPPWERPMSTRPARPSR